jgi:hypothetical protein
MQVARVAGVESEMNMGFAGLHQLLVPFLGGLEALPSPQRQVFRKLGVTSRVQLVGTFLDQEGTPAGQR